MMQATDRFCSCLTQCSCGAYVGCSSAGDGSNRYVSCHACNCGPAKKATVVLSGSTYSVAQVGRPTHGCQCSRIAGCDQLPLFKPDKVRYLSRLSGNMHITWSGRRGMHTTTMCCDFRRCICRQHLNEIRAACKLDDALAENSCNEHGDNFGKLAAADEDNCTLAQIIESAYQATNAVCAEGWPGMACLGSRCVSRMDMTYSSRCLRTMWACDLMYVPHAQGKALPANDCKRSSIAACCAESVA
jgi:hypothetical protein